MAVITEFVEQRSNAGRHPTEVQCGWQVVQVGDEKLLQLSTYGSDHRASGPKVSQTMQLDRAGAEALVTILRSTFPGI